jgi:hypothetical protein
MSPKHPSARPHEIRSAQLTQFNLQRISSPSPRLLPHHSESGRTSPFERFERGSRRTWAELPTVNKATLFFSQVSIYIFATPINEERSFEDTRR